MPPDLRLVLTRDPDLVREALALRRAVFVEEQGARLEAEGDAFDSTCDHLILHDAARPGAGAVATLRLAAGSASTAREFDVSALHASGQRIVETGRACLHRDYRGGLAGLQLFKCLLDAARARGAELLLGTASFPGADPARHRDALRRLRMEALAPEHLRPVARGPGALTVAGTAPRGAMRDVPALIKTYLRAGAWVGEGAYVDTAFDTVDVCILLDLSRTVLPRSARLLGSPDGGDPAA